MVVDSLLDDVTAGMYSSLSAKHHHRIVTGFPFGDTRESLDSMLKGETFQAQREANEANRNVERGLSAMERDHDSALSLEKSRDDSWKTLKKKLKGACEELRSALESSTENNELCHHAQIGEVGMPELFRRLSKNAEKAEAYGPINVCVPKGIKKGVDSPELSPCTCTTGNLATGCLDAKDVSDHQLLCTWIQHTWLPNKKLRKFFEPGGLCNMSDYEDSPINEQLELKSRLGEPPPKELVMPLPLTILGPSSLAFSRFHDTKKDRKVGAAFL